MRHAEIDADMIGIKKCGLFLKKLVQDLYV